MVLQGAAVRIALVHVCIQIQQLVLRCRLQHQLLDDVTLGDVAITWGIRRGDIILSVAPKSEMIANPSIQINPRGAGYPAKRAARGVNITPC